MLARLKVGVAAVAAAVLSLGTGAAGALDPQSFHLVQIEQVVAGVGGDVTAQAIQLRMRSAGERFVSAGKLMAYDAQGLNPVLLLDITADVANGLLGDRVLVATATMKKRANPLLQPDFMMTAPIPAAYLSAGRITWESDFGTVYWSLACGGAGYTGSNAGSPINDNDGNFGPPFGGPFPSATAQGLLFQGAAQDKSSANATDYALTAAGAVLVNNKRKPFTVTVPPAKPSNLAGTEFLRGVSKLTWVDQATTETAFRIQRQQFVGNLWVNLATVSTQPPDTVSYMESPGIGVWRYRVESLTGVVESGYTPYVAIKPIAPSGLTAQNVNGSAQLAWSDMSDFEARFEIQRQHKVNGIFVETTTIATLGVDANAYLDSPGTGTWRYRVRAGSAAGTSLYTPYKTITLP
jgi:hypothetical protein